MSAEQTWTDDELAQFDELIDMVSSPRQMDRISGRLAMKAFVEKHGKEKCDAMFALLEQKRGGQS